ncbi:MAG: hypothetical protein AAF664_11900 [Planctomycetota bacterium]
MKKCCLHPSVFSFLFMVCVFAFALVIVVVRCNADESQFDRYGGLKDIKRKATGFFRLSEIDGSHFLITPEGHGYRALGINHFHNMSSKDYDAAIKQINDWGFNAGCYQGPRWMWNRYPYTKGINLVPVCVWKPDGVFAYKDVFDPSVLAEMENSVRSIVEPQRENPMLIGYFWTDIPIWSRDRDGGWIEFYRSLEEDSAGGKAWREWKSANSDADESEFLVQIAKQLYSKGYEYVRKYDSNHLILGDRYHEIDIPEAIVREAIPYVDAISIQPTSREFNYQFFDDVYERYGKPIYIADHVSSFATNDHPITMGQAAKDPDAYGAYYRRYVTSALSRPYMIGFNKCQYQDQPTPKLLKQGLLDVNEAPYPIVSRIREANFQALDHAYQGTQPKVTKTSSTRLTSETLTIIEPNQREVFASGENVVIKANIDLKAIGGRQVRFYYMDKKWQSIGHDAEAPFEATWRSPPPGEWDIYVAVHGWDWKILSKSRVRIEVSKD